VWELANRLLLVYIGTPHKSSEVHDQVIRTRGASAAVDPRIEALRSLAREAKNAVLGGTLARLGEIMNANTELQKQIHSALVYDKFEQIMEMGKRRSVLGCKVNGAGGMGAP
jgi:galactokinase/mevalonate kinase-like predicted kinase